MFDEKLQKVFKGKKKSTTFFKLNGLLTPLMYKPEEVLGDVEEEEEEEEEEQVVEDKDKPEQDKAENKEDANNSNHNNTAGNTAV